MNAFTWDTFFNGRIRIRQNRFGYRFSLDAVLLASHVQPRAGETVLDLGAGCGIISLILAYRHPDIKIFGVEVQKEIADLAALNVEENQMAGRVAVFRLDMKTLPVSAIPGPVDWVVCNPPYRKVDSGRINPDRQRAIARHEIMVTLKDIAAVSRRMLRTAGKFVTVYPAERLTDLMTEMRLAGIEPKRLRMIHSKRSADAKLVLVEGAGGVRSGMTVCPPLVIYRENGVYTQEVAAMFQP